MKQTTLVCEACSEEFLSDRLVRFCKNVVCRRNRQRERWERWRSAQEPLVFRERENARQQEFRARTGYARDWELKHKYGISLDQWFDMLEKANYVCEVCGSANEVLGVDHCHTTGKVRGVLCKACNRSIGQLGDSPEALYRAYVYLLERT